MDLRFKMLHEANAKLADGFSRIDLLSISDEDFERNHGFKMEYHPHSKK
jgi:hypothetical protein